MTTTDRELLERAAKAHGFIDDETSNDEDSHGLRRNGQGIFYVVHKRGWHNWNPLLDDGDALRLAVKLKINVEHMQTLGGKAAGINCWPIGRGDCSATEEDDLSDYAAATRRAIVRAAAAMAGEGE